MAIILLTARRHPTTGPVERYLWRVHLDDSQTVADPHDPEKLMPDPAWVREWEFPGHPPQTGPEEPNLTVAKYVESQRAEVKLLAEHELERMGGRGKKLAGEGQEL
jgi:hypothetical protein